MKRKKSKAADKKPSSSRLTCWDIPHGNSCTNLVRPQRKNLTLTAPEKK